MLRVLDYEEFCIALSRLCYSTLNQKKALNMLVSVEGKVRPPHRPPTPRRANAAAQPAAAAPPRRRRTARRRTPTSVITPAASTPAAAAHRFAPLPRVDAAHDRPP